MHETQKTISDWGIKTFGYPRDIIVIIDRMLKEVEELKYWIDLGESGYNINTVYDKMSDECADIYIVMCQVMNTMGFDLHSCVDHKMEINRVRKWKSNEDGTGQHIKE